MTKQLSIGDLCTSDYIASQHARVQDKRDRRERLTPEEMFALQCRGRKLPAFVQQCLFAKEALGRRWQFDFAFTQYKVAVEIEGLVVRMLIDPKNQKRVRVVYGRHATIDGFKEDTEKYNSAALLGWTVLRFEQTYVKPGYALETTMRVLASRGWKPNSFGELIANKTPIPPPQRMLK